MATIASACSGGAATTEAPTATEALTAAPTATEAITAAPTATEVAAAASPSPFSADIATAVSTSPPATGGTRIRVTIGDIVLTGQLRDNATARDLIAQLPQTLSFSDFNGLEKIGHLPLELSTDGVPAGDDPIPRDIGYYAPWGNLVFYYGDVGYFSGIVRIGQFDGNVDAIANQRGHFTARIELAN